MILFALIYKENFDLNLSLPFVITIKLSTKIKNKKQNIDFNLSMLMSLTRVHRLSRKLLSNNYR